MNFWCLGKTFVIAEIGVNHEGDSDRAADLIRLAAQCGVDAVKFQTFRAEHYISTVQPERLERARRFQLAYEDFRRLAGVASGCRVVFFSTPLHPDDADFLDTIAPIFKISSGDLTHLSLIRHVAAKGKPIILSTGLGDATEIEGAVSAVLAEQPQAREEGHLMLMHCVAAYPVPDEEANLRNIIWLQETFRLPVGYSDHTLGNKACELAVAVGAVAVEKHFTYRKENQTFHDHALSADPQDMQQLVAVVRQAEVLLGSKERVRSPAEAPMLLNLRRSIGAAMEIPAGVPIRLEWLTYLRPAWGLPPDQAIALVGRCLSRPVAKGDLLRAEDLLT